jgi:hypothetical protein
MARTEKKTARANEPAQPCEEIHGDGTQVIRRHLGLTVRERFVLAAMQGMLASRATDELTYEELAQRAITQADAQIAALALA